MLMSRVVIYSFFKAPLPGVSFERTITDLATRGRRKMVKTSGAPNLQVYVNYGHGDEEVTEVEGAQEKIGSRFIMQLLQCSFSVLQSPNEMYESHSGLDSGHR